ncbi:hypothetical protein GYMLUDRAFT_596666 [Collybiopsis luxurians FD-317 M1]|uniref:Uncharacterized protein n=1 Tax=Collybiopsis luxurians FD-317 M1 TaxID=944289 RepID=A0A0D0BAT8_9AGAR|nr:hypothetical protein GYMLUDRAFT_596666 [Collybiopsis luxurians FD-317 M1]
MTRYYNLYHTLGTQELLHKRLDLIVIALVFCVRVYTTLPIQIPFHPAPNPKKQPTPQTPSQPPANTSSVTHVSFTCSFPLSAPRWSSGCLITRRRETFVTCGWMWPLVSTGVGAGAGLGADVD